VVLTRESGESNAWRRINKAFLHELRKQLLIWRSRDEVEKSRYEKMMTEAVAAKGMTVQGRFPDPAGAEFTLDRDR